MRIVKIIVNNLNVATTFRRVNKIDRISILKEKIAMDIIKGQKQDLSEIVDIISECIKYMVNQGNISVEQILSKFRYYKK